MTGVLESVVMVEVEGLHDLRGGVGREEGVHEAVQGHNAQLLWVHLLQHDLHAANTSHTTLTEGHPQQQLGSFWSRFLPAGFIHLALSKFP